MPVDDHCCGRRLQFHGSPDCALVALKGILINCPLLAASLDELAAMLGPGAS
jgi:hypothetical protein